MEHEAPTPPRPSPLLFGRAHAPGDAALHLLAVPWDAASPRPGAARAPAAIREASQRIETFDPQTGLAHAGAVAMIDPPPALAELAPPGADPAPEAAADLAALERASSAIHAWVARQSAESIAAGKAIGVVGGDRSAPMGAIEALAARVPGLGILHLGAHADLRRAPQGLSRAPGSLLHDVAVGCPGVARIVQVGVRSLGADEAAMIRGSYGRILTFFDADLAERAFAGEPWRAVLAAIVAPLPRDVYVSLAVDALTPDHCPQSPRRAPGGLTWNHLLALLAAVVHSGRVLLGFDLCEVYPAADPRDTWDAEVGARLLARLCALTLRSQRRL